jgi:exosortase A-associated hydrolase 1/exosortase A-associated hydrolase 2
MSQLQTGYLPGPGGSLHVSLFRPGGAELSSHWVLHVPAFGEEMNKSRGMVARQARVLAANGMTVLVPDLFGTGDSAGILEQATWQGWHEDIMYLAKWARGRGATQLTLWGHRMGCLLAADVLRAESVSPAHLLFWQPVHSGKQQMTQFLRLRMAAGLAGGGGETVAQLRELLLQGNSLEVAGYTLPGGLFADIEAVVLARLALPPETRVRILEVVSEAGSPVMPVTGRLIQHWGKAGIDCYAEAAQGAPFWMTQELGFAPELIEKTTAQLVPVGEQNLDSVGSAVEAPAKANSPLHTLPTTSQDAEQSLVFNCGAEELVGILHRADRNSSLGVLIVVGGPQYRVGSHRQFVHLARYLAGQGTTVLRFDYSGMGDSSGELKGFKHISGEIRSAIDAMQREDRQITDVVIWGLCDAATASVFYAASDPRVRGLVLANPWVYSEQGAAKAYLKHYYIQRLFQPEFWGKVRSGSFSISSSLSSAWSMVREVLKSKPVGEVEGGVPGNKVDATICTSSSGRSATLPQDNLVSRFTEALEKFGGDVLIVLSGNDLTAAEFIDATRGNRKLKAVMKRTCVRQITLPGVDHTFSRALWREQVEILTLKAINRL